MRGFFPRPAQVRGDAEPDERPQPGLVHGDRPVEGATGRVQAFGRPVAPGPLADQTAARVASLVRDGRGNVEAQTVTLEIKRIAPLDDPLTVPGGIAAAFPGAAAFNGSVQGEYSLSSAAHEGYQVSP